MDAMVAMGGLFCTHLWHCQLVSLLASSVHRGQVMAGRWSGVPGTSKVAMQVPSCCRPDAQQAYHVDISRQQNRVRAAAAGEGEWWRGSLLQQCLRA